MKIRKTISSLLALLFYSCTSNSSGGEVNTIVNWTSEPSDKIQTCESKATKPSELTNDIVRVLRKIYADSIVNEKQLLFYIDATNGSVFISGFNSDNNEPYTESGVSIELYDLWEQNENALVFDHFVITSIKRAVKKDEFKALALECFYQTELDQVKRIK